MEDGTYPERQKWSRKIEYMFSMIGYSVGLGNIWRFSYICMRNGGGAFLIPFLFFLLTCGLPLYFLEVSVGQFIGRSVICIWEVCPLFRGVGYGMVWASFGYTLYYNIITAWVLYYIVASFFYPLPWSTCDNDWNTKYCISDRLDNNRCNTSNISGIFNNCANISEVFHNCTDTSDILSNCTNNNSRTKPYQNLTSTDKGRLVTSEEEYWLYQVLQKSSGLEDLGVIQWHIPICLFVAWIIIYFSTIRGVKSVGKVVYVTATLPYIILTVLLVRGITLPGGVEGLLYYLTPNFSRLLDQQVWLEAAVQIFFSLGPCWGSLVTMASYNRFDNNCLKDSVFLTLFCEGTSIYGGMAIFTILGYMASNIGLPIDKLQAGGPGLTFIAYPEAISQLPVSNLWAVLFFVMLLTVALDTLFVSVEIICSSAYDMVPKLRKNPTLFTTALCIVLFLLGLPLCTQGGIFIFQLIDWYIGSLSVTIFGIIECLVFGWIYGIDNLSRDIGLMIKRPIPVLFRLSVCFLTPTILLITLILTMLSYQPPTYGSYQYPGYAQIIGWIIASFPFFPVILFFFIEINRAKGETIYDKFWSALRPTSQWKPNNIEFSSQYDGQDRDFRVPFFKRRNSLIS